MKLDPLQTRSPYVSVPVKTDTKSTDGRPPSPSTHEQVQACRFVARSGNRNGRLPNFDSPATDTKWVGTMAPNRRMFVMPGKLHVRAVLQEKWEALDRDLDTHRELVAACGEKLERLQVLRHVHASDLADFSQLSAQDRLYGAMIEAQTGTVPLASAAAEHLNADLREAIELQRWTKLDIAELSRTLKPLAVLEAETSKNTRILSLSLDGVLPTRRRMKELGADIERLTSELDSLTRCLPTKNGSPAQRSTGSRDWRHRSD